jgi:hypothetical protein
LILWALWHLKGIRLEEFCGCGWELLGNVRQFDRPGVKSWTSAEEWSDCERHARTILGEEGFARFMASLSGQETGRPAQKTVHVAEPSLTYGPGTPGAQRRLFPGEPTLSGDPKEDLPRGRKRRQ